MPENPASPFPAVNRIPPLADDKLMSPVVGFKDIELPKVPVVLKLRVVADEELPLKVVADIEPVAGLQLNPADFWIAPRPVELLSLKFK